MAYVPSGKPRGRPRAVKPVESIPPDDPNTDPVVDGPMPTPEEISAASRVLSRAGLGKSREAASARKKKTLNDFAKEFDFWRKRYLEAVDSGSKEIPSLRAAREMVLDEARAHGISMSSLIDRRSDADKIQEVVDKLLGTNPSLLELLDEEVEAVEKGIERSIQLMQAEEDRAIGDEMVKEDAATARARRLRLQLGKAWRERLARLKNLKMLAREPFPPICRWTPLMDQKIGVMTILSMGSSARAEARAPMLARAEHIMRASLVLRHMAYTMRSNMSERQKKGSAASIFDFQPHHAQAAWELYHMNNSSDWSSSGVIPCEPWEGTILVAPPGLGKTSIGVGFFSLEIAQNRYNKILMGHAIEDLATANQRYLASMFRADGAAGRRMAALYGAFEYDKASDHEFRLVMDDKSKQSTLTAHGMDAEISGSDASWVWIDDPVNKAEREQPEERRRKADTIQQVWLARLRGKLARYVTTTTLWHEDDANCRRIAQAREGKIRVRVMVLRHGGPDDKPQFWSLWPQEFPPQKLQALYNADPAGYSACYMSDPRIESMRVIRKLRFYDPASDQHRNFMRGAVMHLSADPAATTRAKSDKAGLIYAAHGDVTGAMADGSLSHESRLRIIAAREFHATQSALVAEVANFATSSKVDYVHVETVAGFAATAEMLSNQYGVDAICHQPGMKNKEVRLKGVATLIDNSMKGNAHGGAVVEFPGIWNEQLKRVMPDPSYNWLYEQFLRFGMVKADHAVDAVVQLVAHLQRTGGLNSGLGFVSQSVRKTEEVNERVAMLKQMLAEAQDTAKKDVDAEDAEFMAGGGDSWM